MTYRGVRAVFLDAGHTLLYTDPPVERVYREAFERHGLRASAEDVHQALHATWKDVSARHRAGEERWGAGDPDGEAAFWRKFVATVFERLGGGTLPPALLRELVAHFQAEKHWRVYDDVRGVVTELRRRGYKVLIVSNWDSSLALLLERLELLPLFDAVLMSAIVGVSKPSSEIFEVALTRAEVEKHEALHVGDSVEEDCGGAERAGLSAILLDRTGTHETPYTTIRSLTSLLDLLPGLST